MRHSNTRRSKSNRSNGKRPYNNGPNRNYESNGAGAKLRGTASQVFDKYIALARDASSGGDRISAENFFQHAEHYHRVQNLLTSEKKAKESERSTDDVSSTSKDTLENTNQDAVVSSITETSKVSENLKEPSQHEEAPKSRPKGKKSSTKTKNAEQSEGETVN